MLTMRDGVRGGDVAAVDAEVVVALWLDERRECVGRARGERRPAIDGQVAHLGDCEDVGGREVHLEVYVKIWARAEGERTDPYPDDCVRVEGFPGGGGVVSEVPERDDLFRAEGDDRVGHDVDARAALRIVT